VDVVDHRGERRRLAAAGRAGDQDQAAPLRGDPLDHRREAEIADVAHPRRDESKRRLELATLIEDVHAEAAELGEAVAGVDLPRLLQPARRDVTEQLVRDRRDDVALEPRPLLPRDERSADTKYGERPGLQMDVGCLAADPLTKDRVQQLHASFLSA